MRHSLYWDQEKKLEVNLQQAAHAYLEVLNDIAEKLGNVENSIDTLSGLPQNLSNVLTPLVTSIEGLTLAAEDAVERSMRNATLDTMREQNAALQGRVTEVQKELDKMLQMVGSLQGTNEELQRGNDLLKEQLSELQQALNAKET